LEYTFQIKETYNLKIIMKAKFYILGALMALVNVVVAQDRTTVRANSVDISDNLDLRAVASLFGESKDIIDFEQRLNDPSIQISNLDLNNDNQVDYLRVLETVEDRTHLIIIQAVLGYDVFQDVATVEVEKDRNNKVSIQIVGDVYMYGTNYIYEPVYVHTPVIYTRFWTVGYVAYYSPWYWNAFPTYYVAWKPFPIYRYRNHIHGWINVNNSCHYVTHRKSTRAVALYNTRRSNGYEKQHPTRSFASRNANATNRYELVQTRDSRTTRNNNTVANRASVTEKNSNVKTIATRNDAVKNTRTTATEAMTRNQGVRNTNDVVSLRSVKTANASDSRNQAKVEIKNTTARTTTAVSRDMNSSRSTTATAPRTIQFSENNRSSQKATPTPSMSRSESRQSNVSQNRGASGNTIRNNGNTTSRSQSSEVGGRRG
jgi:hypothetical protein